MPLHVSLNSLQIKYIVNIISIVTHSPDLSNFQSTEIKRSDVNVKCIRHLDTYVCT